MEPININSISKKSLKVSLPKTTVKESINEEPSKEIQEPIEAPKKTKKAMMTLEEEKPVSVASMKIDGRGKSDKIKENLAKGRAKLVEVWAEKKKIKEDLMNAALEKKVQQRLKQKQKINEAFGINSDDDATDNESDGLDENGYTPKQAEQIKLKEQKKQELLQQKEQKKQQLLQQKQNIIAPKKEKKKVIKYIEVESSSSEEEEIVYVKKQKSQKAPQSVVQQPQVQQQQLMPRIQFF
tara:strand:+ start:1501 stop:2217 length:717 start_codon:yes stop_codon:yes gene_type:complete